MIDQRQRIRVIVTRPAREAAVWVKELRAFGFDPLALPLIDIVPPLDLTSLESARSAICNYAAVMFVSPNAVDGFMPGLAAQGEGVAVIVSGTRAWSPGPGTTRALHLAGWPAESIDEPARDSPQFDSEALWVRVEHQIQAGARVLIVRGADARGQPAGRDWLAKQLRARGVVVDEVAAYRRVCPVFDAASHYLAVRNASDASVWLFSSSEAISNLQKLLPEQDWSAARAVATHERIAQSALRAGFGRVAQSRPTVQSVVASIESLS